jgi:hypothetical protein
VRAQAVETIFNRLIAKPQPKTMHLERLEKDAAKSGKFLTLAFRV